MQMVSEVMTRNVQFVSPQENLQRAAQMMDELNAGALPVCDDEQLIGMITNRDITVRATAVRRVPVVSHNEQHKLIGIIALGDLVTKTSEGAQKDEAQHAMEKISSPSQPDMPQQSGNANTAGRGINAAAGAAGASARTAVTTANSGNGAPGGTDAAGASGASGGTADMGGSGRSGVGAKP